MSIQTVNLGTYANDGTGDDLRTAFEKVIGNFDYLDLIKTEDGENLGTAVPNTHGVYAGVDGITLQFKSIRQGDNIVITSDGNTITLRPKDSINAVEEDTSPTLGGDLNTGGFDIYSEGLPLNLYVKDNFLNIYNYNTSTGNYLPLALNALQLIGNNFNAPGTTTLTTYPGDGLVINSDLQLVLTSDNGVLIDTDLTVSDSITAASFIGPLTGNVTGNTNGTHTGPVIGNVTGTVTGNVTGDLTGNVTGNVLGQVSDISNHFLRDLADVGSNIPGSGNVLSWNGTAWVPTDLGSSVSQIVAGTNVSISPGGGTGVVTINASMNLDALTDVQVTAPSNDQVLKYDGTRWINAASPPTVSNLDDLTDVAVTAPAADQVLKYNGSTWVNAASPAGLPSILDFDLGVIGANITNPLQLLFQALNVDFDTFTNPSSFNIDLGTLGDVEGPVEWTSGNVDGGSPSTSIFDYYIDGGSPSTVSFSAIADGGTTLGSSVDGGSPGGSPSLFVDGGSPSSTQTSIIDGGLPA